eukprot:scaffold1193_cov159-Ochromonas_danica.AAC.13
MVLLPRQKAFSQGAERGGLEEAVLAGAVVLVEKLHRGGRWRGAEEQRGPRRRSSHSRQDEPLAHEHALLLEVDPLGRAILRASAGTGRGGGGVVSVSHSVAR